MTTTATAESNKKTRNKKNKQHKISLMFSTDFLIITIQVFLSTSLDS